MKLSDFDTGKLVGAKTDRGYNMTTATGRAFWPADPRPEDVFIEDIAPMLSRQCRFNGAMRSDVEIYTVAQHCCLVSDHLPDELKLEGLLHDAAEAYTGDLIKPIKLMLPGWKAIERDVERAVRNRFNLPPTMTPAVKEQDRRAVATEHRDLQPHTGEVDWGDWEQYCWPEKIMPCSVRHSWDAFMVRYWKLSGGLT
jgi:hypothetical protein